MSPEAQRRFEALRAGEVWAYRARQVDPLVRVEVIRTGTNQCSFQSARRAGLRAGRRGELRSMGYESGPAISLVPSAALRPVTFHTGSSPQRLKTKAVSL